MYHGFLMRCDATARGRLAIAEIGALLRAKFAHPVRFLTSRSPDIAEPVGSHGADNLTNLGEGDG
jgi:hypothetical protein